MPIDASFPVRWSSTIAWVAFLRRHPDDAVVEYQRAPDISPNFAAAHGHLGSALAFDGSRTEAYKVLWTGRCDWDCDSVLARIARLGLLYGHRSGENQGGVNRFLRKLWGRSLTEGSRKNGI